MTVNAISSREGPLTPKAEPIPPQQLGLPREMWNLIFSHPSFEDIPNCARVCKCWCKLLKDERLKKIFICKFIRLKAKNESARSIAKECEEKQNFSELIKIRYLDLSSRDIKTLPDEIYHLSGLRSLNLFNNDLVTLPPSFFRLTKLTSLDIRGNKFTEVPKVILELKSLDCLEIDENKIEVVPLSLKGKVITLPYNARWIT